MIAIARAAAALVACCLALPAAASETSLEAEVLARINYVRAHPREYARQLREYRRHFEGRVLHLPGDANGTVTREGVDAVDEAIDFLERQTPLTNLELGQLLMLAAQDHADEQGEAGATGHRSPDGLSPGERVKRRGGDIYVGESISYGFDDAEAVVRQLVIDDGVPGRGHRALLFGSDFRFAGVGCAPHRMMRHLCVVDLSATANGAPLLPKWAQSPGARTFTYRGAQR